MKKFIWGKPEEGTPTLGVVFHVIYANMIEHQLQIKPVGYVVDVDYTCEACGAESENSHSRACHRTIECDGR